MAASGNTRRSGSSTSRRNDLPESWGDGFLRRLVTKAHFELWRAGAKGREDPLDIAQEVLIDLYRLWVRDELRTTEPGDLLRGLAGTMARRTAIDVSRRASRRRTCLACEDDGATHGADLDAMPAVITSTTARIRRLDARDQATRILDHLADREGSGEGTPGDYEVFVLRHVEGLSYGEIAGQRGEGETAEAIRSRLRRIHASIRHRFPLAGKAI